LLELCIFLLKPIGKLIKKQTTLIATDQVPIMLPSLFSSVSKNTFNRIWRKTLIKRNLETKIKALHCKAHCKVRVLRIKSNETDTKNSWRSSNKKKRTYCEESKC